MFPCQPDIMMQDIDLFDLFNRKIIEFAKDLIYIFPSMNDFKIFLDSCVWSAAIDKAAPQALFEHLVVKPFGEKILHRDESFFLYESYNDYNEYMQHYGHDLNLIHKLKGIWKNLDDENKGMIWKYMQVLLVLSQKCCGKSLDELDSSIFVHNRA